ncbi:unnamed protein product [Clonostachys solani]|uniref:Enoyl reductase (ER) domain-containing protein n=1 Tax=Clonostachys solani TaxID=160281 RepID=A0A9P0EQ83_9HYPO|nr:unnamed protein product [Clonostachys solani]
MATIPLQTRGLVTEASKAGYKLMPVVLDDMRPDEVLVEMKYSGICHTDLIGANGAYDYILEFPAVLGHEGAGVIRAVGSSVKDTNLKVGTSVILSFNHCGSCSNCNSQHPACCVNFEALNLGARRLTDKTTSARLQDGRRLVSQFFGQSSFLNHSVVSKYSVIPCPYPEDLAVYSALGCGFQTGAGTVLNSLRPTTDDSLVVFGAGTVGVAAIMAAKYLDLRQIIAIDQIEERLTISRELGATHTINTQHTPDFIREIHSITGGGARYVLECTGVSLFMEKMLECVCCGGCAVVVGVPKPDFILKIDPMKLLHENKTIQLHRSGNFPLEKLCTFYEVSNFDECIQDTRDGKIIKPILKW